MQCRSEAHLNDVGRSGTLRYGAAVRLKTWHDAGPGFAKGQRESSVEIRPTVDQQRSGHKGGPLSPQGAGTNGEQRFRCGGSGTFDLPFAAMDGLPTCLCGQLK